MSEEEGICFNMYACLTEKVTPLTTCGNISSFKSVKHLGSGATTINKKQLKNELNKVHKTNIRLK